MNNYWLYLEPYTFIFRNEKEAVLYNSINGAYLLYRFNTHPIKQLIDELEKTENGYGVLLSEKEQEPVLSFLKDIRETFSGDCIQIKDESSRPFIFKPICRIMEERLKHKKAMEKDILESYGAEILASLNEVTLLFGGKTNYNISDKYPYHRQFIHSMYCEHDSKSLQFTDYQALIKQLENIGIGRLNIAVDSIDNHFIYQLYETLKYNKFKVSIYCNYETLHTDCIRLFENTPLFTYHIHIHKINSINELQKDIEKIKMPNVVWNAIVSSAEELFTIQQTNDTIHILPYYNGTNEHFFMEYIYNDLDAILEYPVDKQTIFRRQTLNENFFGNLFILPNGEVHANMNTMSLENINNMSLAEIVYKEMTQSTAWFKLREEKPCKNCVNKFLCPSISNYELVIGKTDLCHIKQYECNEDNRVY